MKLLFALSLVLAVLAVAADRDAGSAGLKQFPKIGEEGDLANVDEALFGPLLPLFACSGRKFLLAFQIRMSLRMVPTKLAAMALLEPLLRLQMKTCERFRMLQRESRLFPAAGLRVDSENPKRSACQEGAGHQAARDHQGQRGFAQEVL